MKKIFIFLILLCIFSFFIFLIIDLKSGVVVFNKSIPQNAFFTTNKLGPVYLNNNKVNYGGLLEIEFKGALSINYKIQIVNTNNEIVFSDNGTVVGETDGKNYGKSLEGFKIFKIKENGNYFIIVELFPSKYKCEIKDISLQVKKNKIKIETALYKFSLLGILFGIILLLISTVYKF